MPFSITTDDKRRLITTGYVGEVGITEMRSAIEAVTSMLEDDSKYRILTDFTGVESWVATTRDLRGLGMGMLPRGRFFRIERSALVAPQSHIFGDLRAWVAMTRRLPFNRVVFREMAAALRWLDTGQGNGGIE